MPVVDGAWSTQDPLERGIGRPAHERTRRLLARVVDLAAAEPFAGAGACYVAEGT